MTTADFQKQFPKPWHFVMNEVTFSLIAANGAKVALLTLTSGHYGIPQREWNRHIAAALREVIQVDEGRRRICESAFSHGRRAQSQRPTSSAMASNSTATGNT